MADTPLTIAQQAQKIEEDCERAAIRDALVSSMWDRYNLYLGLSSTILAATAAFLAGAGHDVLNIINVQYANAYTAFLALASSVLASTLTFLTPSERAKAYQQTSNKYHSLRERIRFFISTRCPTNADDLVEELKSFMIAKEEIDTDHPILPEWSYTKTHERIKQKIKRNEELDKLRGSVCLPANGQNPSR